MRIGTAIAMGSVMALAGGGFTTAAESAPAPLTLTRAGQPAAAIVLAAKPTEAAQFAAFELQWHIQAIAGATLPIWRGDAAVPKGQVKLYVGDGPRARALGLTPTAFKLQEYAVRSGANEVVLVGKDAADFAEVKYDLDALNDGQKNANWPGFWEERGTLHAVYDFLREGCGVRWFNPTDTGTLISPQPTLTVKAMNLRRTPTFRYRDAIGAIGDPAAYDRCVSIWGNREPGFKAWEAAAYADSRRRQGESLTVKRSQATLFLLRMRNGGELCRANHSLYHYYSLFWRSGQDEAAAKYFKGRRPELFAQGYEGDQPPQMCYTSRALVAQVAQEARDYFNKGGYPYKVDLGTRPIGAKWGENFFCVEPMDNESFCKCPACQKLIAQGKNYGAVNCFSRGIYSDYWFNFVNEVARELKPLPPGKHLVTLAYGSHAWLPKTIKLDPSVAVQFCFAADSAPWLRSEYDNELRLLRAWGAEAKKSGRPLYAWCYFGHLYRAFADGGNFYCFPGFFAHAMAQELTLYQQLGYRGMFHCGLPTEVDTYVMFRLMDNDHLDVDKVLDEYFTGLYGAAAAPLKELYLAIEKVYGDPQLRPADKNVSGGSIEVAWGSLGTAERMAAYGQLLDQARHRATTAREKRNVALFDLAIWQYMLAGRQQYLERTGAPIPSATVPRAAAGHPDWSKAVTLGPWHSPNSAQPAARPLTARALHDDQFLYLELTDPVAPSKLQSAAMVFPCDTWVAFSKLHDVDRLAELTLAAQ